MVMDNLNQMIYFLGRSRDQHRGPAPHATDAVVWSSGPSRCMHRHTHTSVSPDWIHTVLDRSACWSHCVPQGDFYCYEIRCNKWSQLPLQDGGPAPVYDHQVGVGGLCATRGGSVLVVCVC